MSTPKKTKTLLKVNPVSSGHWSSGKSKEETCQTKCVVQIIKASQLLASDAETGKSDPVCFIKFSPQYTTPDWENFNSPDNGILSTSVVQACTEPIWNSHHTFPLILESYQELLNASIDLLIRDEDLEDDGTTSYDDLGKVRIPLRDSINIAKIAQRHNKNAFLGAPVWHTLEKCQGMRKQDGKILVSISIHFEDSDTKQIQKEIGVNSVAELMSRYKAEASEGDAVAGFSATTASAQHRRSSGALTPRTSTPVRLFNDSSNTPLLQLAIPEESFQKGNNSDRPSNGNRNDRVENVNENNGGSGVTKAEERGASAGERVALSDLNPNLDAVQSEEELQRLAEDDKPSRSKVEDKETTEDASATARRKAKAEEEGREMLNAAVKQATEAAKVEASRIIARAKEEIEDAREAASKQLVLQEAVYRTTREVLRDTEEQVSRLREEAKRSAGLVTKSEVHNRAEHPLHEGGRDLHEGDLYWDENDNVAGGNYLESGAGKKKENENKKENRKAAVAAADAVPTDKPPPKFGHQKGEELVRPSLNSKLSTVTQQSEKKSKIPKLTKTLSNPALPTSKPPPAGEVSTAEESKAAKKKRIAYEQEKNKSAARSRIELAKQEFKRRQAAEAGGGGGSSHLAFIPMDDLEPTGGDELWLPGGGDEELPPGYEEKQEEEEDEMSVASTTGGDEEEEEKEARALLKRGTSFPGQGSRPDTIRALREISQQRERMDKALAELQRSSDEKFALVQRQLSEFQTSGGTVDRDDYMHDDRRDGGAGKEATFTRSRQMFSKSADRSRKAHAPDTPETMSQILQHGDADDIGMMLEKFRAEYTEVLPLSTRSRLFECISTLLRRGKYKDTCLEWIVALLNTSTGENLVQTLPDYTCKSIVAALVVVSGEPSNRGILAARLEAQMLHQYEA